MTLPASPVPTPPTGGGPASLVSLVNGIVVLLSAAIGSVATVLTARWNQRSDALKAALANETALKGLKVKADGQHDTSELSWADRAKDLFDKYEALSETVSQLRVQVADLSSYRKFAENHITTLEADNTNLRNILHDERKSWSDQSASYQLTIQALQTTHQHVVSALAILSPEDNMRVDPAITAIAASVVKNAVNSDNI